MSKREFLKNNRKELDRIIREKLNDPEYLLNDEERWQWVQNNEGLYLWAKREGVAV